MDNDKELNQMQQSEIEHHCLNCGRKDNEIPLVSLRYDGQSAWICSQCLPILIHKPHQLAGKIRNAADLQGAPPDHH